MELVGFIQLAFPVALYPAVSENARMVSTYEERRGGVPVSHTHTSLSAQYHVVSVIAPNVTDWRPLTTLINIFNFLNLVLIHNNN